MKKTLAVIAVATFVVVSCTKKEAAPEAAAPSAPAAEAVAQAPAQPKATPDVEITVGTDGDQMAFDKKEFEVKAGSTVKLIFKNNAKPGGLQHNLMVVKPGTENDVANAAVAAGNDKGWVPQGNPNVLFTTKLVDPQGTDSVVFVAPAAGDYPYICTFPGHAMVMKGIMHSK
ncbi:MAG: plastocyanin/azurin family copper-binding protein [Oligoflexia bacterium]